MAQAGPLTAIAPTVALLPWGDVIEDFLDHIGIDFESFRTEMDGGWLFGYVEALRTAGVASVLVCTSLGFTGRRPIRLVHEPTRAPLWVLPASRSFRTVRRHHRVAERLGPRLATPLRGLSEVLRVEGCSAILCQEYEYARFDACVAVGRAMRIPVIGVFQGGTPSPYRIDRWVRRRTVAAAAGLVVGSSGERARVLATYDVPDERIAPVFNPLDLRRWTAVDRTEARRSLGLGPRQRVVAWHGRIDMTNKGLDVLVDAWAEVERETEALGLDAQLVLLGTGPDSSSLSERIATSSLRRVRWHDEYVLDRERIRALLGAADVYVFPSRHEGFPVAPIEAMAMGLPLVAADAPGIADILAAGEDSGGVVVTTGDAPGMAGALTSLLADPPRAAALGRRARDRVRSAFSLEGVGADLRSFLDGLPRQHERRRQGHD